jgi:cytoskeletal protein CcmA (bactofilin family)
MFRKKDSDTDAPAGAEGAFRRPVGEGVKPTTQPDLPRRKVDLPSSTGAGATSTEGTLSVGDREPEKFGGKRLIVGEGIRLSGEISSCDRLVVEGEVEVTLNDTLALEIASTGRFTGGCEVEEADISGIYEGDLTVRRRLTVRDSGRLTGTVRYGELELERGGQIAGNISVLASEGAAAGGERPRSALFSERTPSSATSDDDKG